MELIASQDTIRIDSREPSFSVSPTRPLLKHLRQPSLLSSRTAIRRRANGEAPRVLLFVPPYTRLIEPTPHDSAFARIGIDTFEVMKRAGTPIGLLRIATVARRAGYDVQIVDAPFAGWSQEHSLVQVDQGNLIRYGLNDTQLREIIETSQPDIVGIQCNYTVQWGNARALAELVKSIDPNLVLVTGGAHSSGDWKNALLDSAFDFALINEADRAFTLLLDALTHEGTDIDAIPGVAYRDSRGQLVRPTQKSSYLSIVPKRQGLDERLGIMPLPDFSFLDMSHYLQPYHSSGARVRKHGAWAQIFSTIGCNVNCNFCYIPKINGPWRALGLDWFDLHLADLVRQGVTEVLIEDDHLMHDPLYAMEVGRLLKKHDLPWVEEGGLSLFNLILLHLGESFIAQLDENERRNPQYRNVIEAIKGGLNAREFIHSIAENGCYNVYLAVESANEESLVNSNKSRFNAIQQSTFELIEIFTEHGIQVTGGFMLGFVNPPERPGQEPFIESLELIERTIDYAVTLMGAGMAYANPFIVTPIPGTSMWEYQQQYVVRHYDNGWSHEKATMATEHWSAEEIEKARMELLVRANGVNRVREMVRRGTWPVNA
ncbi:cobalamin-dependent protein [Pseudomonas sp. G34]|uniref:B12-binding domain-containing radical SAM protein n=1 Tax=Pseudomonas sp. G34 TaxID=3059083 RepID=UPI002807033B|nr:cobalamin-dependent protein [Pseudomonas sp. G34]MDQ7987174.1 cobalamin-dependent protein [Pseudomonas sp. G34]